MSKKKNKKKAPTDIGWVWLNPWLGRYAIVIAFAAVLFFRPFVDGIVWPATNSYFAWAICLVFAAWSGRVLLKGGTLRGGLPMGIYGVFVVMGLFTMVTSIRVDLTYNAIPALMTTAMALVLGLNVASDEGQRRIVIGAVVAACFFEALYGMYHVMYVLPQAREAINTNPILAEIFFPGAVLTDDLRDRLESNRAFGTFLFPNAFAGFMILGLPIAIAAACRAYIKDDGDDRESGAPLLPVALKDWPASAKGMAFGLFLAVFTGVLIATEFFIEVALQTDFENTSPLRSSGFRYSCSFGLAGAASVIPTFLATQYGLSGARVLLARGLAPLAAIIIGYGMYISGTRGAVLGILAAMCVTGGLFIMKRVQLKRAAATALVVLLAVGAMAALVPADAVAQQGAELNTAGREGDSSLGRYFTILYRIHYWRIAWAAFTDHVAGGVGLGAYETAFTRYQYMGAPTAMMVHNDYLQALAETGLVGGFGFIGFWIVFAVAGGRSILRETDWSRSLAIAGPYTGCLAFAAHQFVDFGFQNPSLTLPVFAVAGICLAQARPVPLRIPVVKPLLIVFLIAAAMVAGWTSRMFVANKAFESLGPRPLRRSAAAFVLFQSQKPSAKPVFMSANAITSFIGNSKNLQSIGTFGVPTETPGTYREIPVSATLPTNAAFHVDNFEAATSIGKQALRSWIERYEVVDAKYPYSPDLAQDIRMLLALLWRAEDDAEVKEQLAHENLKWSYTMLERSPYDGWAMYNVAWSEWMIARSESDPTKRIEKRRKALEKFRAVIDLLPSQAFVYHEYSLRITDVIIDVGESDAELAEWLVAEREWADSQEQMAIERSPYSLTGETHADILRKWPELKPAR